MLNKITSKYFWDINMFNIPFSMFFAFSAGILWSVIIFSSFGILVGYFGYQTFKKNEYYSYYNLGYTKVKLLSKVWLFNSIISIAIFLIYIILK